MPTLNERCQQAAFVLANTLIKHAPKDTWNLALNSIRVIQDGGFFYVLVGGEIAPYAVYTNEPWEEGTNPNEGWINRAVEEANPLLAKIFQGTYTEDDIQTSISNNEKVIHSQFEQFIDLKKKELAKLQSRIRG